MIGRYNYTPEDCRTSLQRHARLMEELEVLDGDILCLQEVGVEYQPLLDRELEKRGYRGEYCRHVHEGDGQGDATFFKIDKFDCLQVVRLTFNEMVAEAVEEAEQDKEVLKKCLKDETFLILKLKHLQTGKTITIGNIHTIWEHFTQLDVSALHIALSLSKLAKYAENNSFIIAGDFNSPPNMAPYLLLTNGYVPDDQKTQLMTAPTVSVQGRSLYELLPDCYSHRTRDLASSYLVAMGREPGVTIFNDYDGHSLLDTCLDYICYTAKTLQVVSVLDTARPAKLLPDQVFPSDHLSLKSTFTFKTDSY